MRDHYNEELIKLNEELISMGALCETAIASAVKALLNGSPELAADVSAAEKAIDAKERNIESLCVKLILSQQPVAHDLMFISAALKMITDMERIGDQAADIAELISSSKLSVSGKDKSINDMSETVIKMVTESVDAFVRRDVNLAAEVKHSDNIVDDLFNRIKSDLVLEVSGGRATVEESLDILMIIKYLERIADHAVNIAEWVDFAVTGKHALKENESV